MEEKKFNKERTTEEILFAAIDECNQKIKFKLNEFRTEVEKLMLEEFHARFKNIKDLYDLEGYGICITEVIALGKRLEDYIDEMNKIETEILSLIDDKTEEY